MAEADKDQLGEMFPDLDLTAVLTDHSEMDVQALAGWIIDNANSIPKRPKQEVLQHHSHCPEAIVINTSTTAVAKPFNYMDALIQCWKFLLIGRRQNTNTSPAVECMVCLETVDLSDVIFCVKANNTNNDQQQQPGTSKSTTTSDAAAEHPFCRNCINGNALAITHDMPMAEGGIGFKCMEQDCSNILLMSECIPFIEPNTRQLLNERIIEESLQMARLENIERCNKCNYALQMDAPKEQQKVFTCLNCSYEFCRLCTREWDTAHFGRRCDEIDKSRLDKEARQFENKISEVIIRKCPHCSLPFVKEEGCNRMTCRCGMRQCYICRKSGITYDHFCPHSSTRTSTTTQTNCTKCNKPCLMWETPKTKEKLAILSIVEEAAQKGVELKGAGD